MRIFIICSKQFYGRLPEIQFELEAMGHTVVLPNCHDAPETEELNREKGKDVHAQWKGEMLKKSEETIRNIDAVLVLNYEKNGIENYIGGATFLEMYDAFRHGKKIFLIHPIPEGILRDEILAFNPIVLHGDVHAMNTR